MTEQDVKRKWQEDAEASLIFAEAKEKVPRIIRHSFVTPSVRPPPKRLSMLLPLSVSHA